MMPESVRPKLAGVNSAGMLRPARENKIEKIEIYTRGIYSLLFHLWKLGISMCRVKTGKFDDANRRFTLQLFYF